MDTGESLPLCSNLPVGRGGGSSLPLLLLNRLTIFLNGDTARLAVGDVSVAFVALWGLGVSQSPVVRRRYFVSGLLGVLSLLLLLSPLVDPEPLSPREEVFSLRVLINSCTLCISTSTRCIRSCRLRHRFFISLCERRTSPLRKRCCAIPLSMTLRTRVHEGR